MFKIKCAMFGKYCPAYDSPVMYLANESSQSCTHVSKKKVAAVASWLATVYKRALMA